MNTWIRRRNVKIMIRVFIWIYMTTSPQKEFMVLLRMCVFFFQYYTKENISGVPFYYTATTHVVVFPGICMCPMLIHLECSAGALSGQPRPCKGRCVTHGSQAKWCSWFTLHVHSITTRLSTPHRSRCHVPCSIRSITSYFHCWYN